MSYTYNDDNDDNYINNKNAWHDDKDNYEINDDDDNADDDAKYDIDNHAYFLTMFSTFEAGKQIGDDLDPSSPNEEMEAAISTILKSTDQLRKQLQVWFTMTMTMHRVELGYINAS